MLTPKTFIYFASYLLVDTKCAAVPSSRSDPTAGMVTEFVELQPIPYPKLDKM